MNAHGYKKWLPFILLLTAAVVLSVASLYKAGDGLYRPTSADPSIVYREACASCHGAAGEGNGVYPGLEHELLLADQVRKTILEGDLFMPAYQHINGDTLEALVDFVAQKKFLSTK